jgi:hypothetical protein
LLINKWNDRYNKHIVRKGPKEFAVEAGIASRNSKIVKSQVVSKKTSAKLHLFDTDLADS